MREKGFLTKVIHTNYTKLDSHNSLQMPIYSNVAFEFDTAQEMEESFLGRAQNHIYSRISNPTVEYLENKIQAVTESAGVIALSSGMAAISNVMLTIAKAGNNIVTSKHLFGNTLSLFDNTLKPFGIEPRYCDMNSPESVKKQIDSETVAIFFETITNPHLEVADISSISKIAKEKNILLIADSTLTPLNVFKAKDFGINLEIISSTKLISGGATSIGGLIIDYGNYNWSNLDKFKTLYIQLGPYTFLSKFKREVFRNIGSCLSPFNAYLHSIGLETLILRQNKSASNAMHIAEFLSENNKVLNINYPGLKNSEFYEISMKQFGDLPCSILAFELQSKDKCFNFLNNLKIIRRATNIYDNKTLAIHPASTIFAEYSQQQREEMGVSDRLVRISVGIEDYEDLIEDINRSLE